MNIKRITALASTALVTTGLVATALAQGKTDLSVLWMTGGAGDQAVMERYGKLYEAANPNVSVQLTFVPLPQLAQKLQLMVAGKTPPDVSRITTSTIADFAPLAADLTGTINPKDFMPSQLPYVQSGKRLIGAPLDITVTALYYNKDCFAEAGIKVPSKPELAWSWEQWRGVMETVTKKSKCRYALSWEPTTHRWGAALYQAGGRYISNDGKKFVVDGPEGLRAFTFFHDLFKDNLIPKGIWLSGEDATGYFKSGLTSMFMATSSHIPLLEPIQSFKWGALPMPKDKYRSTNPGGTFVMGFKDSKNPAEGAKFIKWITSQEVNAALSKDGRAMSARKDSQDIKYGAFDDEYQFFRSDLATSPAYTGKDGSNPAMAKLNTFIREQLVKMILDQQTPKQALEAITVEGEKYLK